MAETRTASHLRLQKLRDETGWSECRGLKPYPLWTLPHGRNSGVGAEEGPVLHLPAQGNATVGQADL